MHIEKNSLVRSLPTVLITTTKIIFVNLIQLSEVGIGSGAVQLLCQCHGQ